MFNLMRIGGALSALMAVLPIVGLIIIFSTGPTLSPLEFNEEESGGWIDVFQEKNTFSLLIASLKLGLAVSFFSTVFGSYIAWISHRTVFVGQRVLSALCLLPLAMPSYVLALSLNGLLSDQDYLWDSFKSGFWPVCLCLSIVCAPYAQLTVGSALQRLSAAEEEAAILLGGNSWRVFKICIWPTIRPAIAFSMLISFLYAISDFGALVFLDYPALTWRLYDAANGQDMAGAAVLGVGLLVCVLPVLACAQWLRGGVKKSSGVANQRAITSRPATPLQRFLFLVLSALIIGVGLFIPGIVLWDWSFSAYMDGATFESPWGAVADTLKVALLGAAFTVLLSFPAAWSSARHKEGPLLMQFVYLSSALPGVLLAFGLMAVALDLTHTAANYRLLMSSGILLFLGYAMRFSAESFGPLSAGISQIDKRQEESSVMLGATPWRWMRQVVLPLLKPNLTASYIIAFLAIMKELPVTMLLGQTMGFKSLAWRIYDRQTEGDLHDAALHSLLLVGMALAIAIISQKWRRNV